MSATPSPSTPQEVPQANLERALLITQMAEAFLRWPLPESVCSDLCVCEPNYKNPRYGTNLLSFAEANAMFDAIVSPALTAATEEVERLRQEVSYLKTYVIPEKDKHGKYWEDLAQQRIAQLAKHKAWGDKAREALQEQVSFLEICETAEDRSNLDGDSADAVLEQINDEAEKDLPKLKALLAAHPGEDSKGAKP